MPWSPASCTRLLPSLRVSHSIRHSVHFLRILLKMVFSCLSFSEDMDSKFAGIFRCKAMHWINLWYLCQKKETSKWMSLLFLLRIWDSNHLTASVRWAVADRVVSRPLLMTYFPQEIRRHRIPLSTPFWLPSSRWQLQMICFAAHRQKLPDNYSILFGLHAFYFIFLFLIRVSNY